MASVLRRCILIMVSLHITEIYIQYSDIYHYDIVLVLGFFTNRINVTNITSLDKEDRDIPFHFSKCL